MDAFEQVKTGVPVADLLPAGQLGLGNGSKVPCFLPGHERDRTASFHVFEHNNSWCCFGCGRGGSVIDLQMILTGQTAGEAMRTLAERHGIRVEKLTPVQEKAAEDERLRAAALGLYMEVATARLLPADPSTLSPKMAEVLSYLRGRGLSDDTLRQARVGFDDGAFAKAIASGNWAERLTGLGLQLEDFLHLENEDGSFDAHPQSRTGLGLIRKLRSGKARSYLHGRIVLPLLSFGRVLNVTGRALPEAEAGGARKYLNLRGGIGALYGEDRVRSGKAAFLVEGPFDALALHQLGEAAVAQFGTQGLSRASRLTQASTIYLLLDRDKAGEQATHKAGRTLIGMGACPYIVRLPEGVKDPGEWLQNGALTAEALGQALQGAEAWPKAYLSALDKGIPHHKNEAILEFQGLYRKAAPGTPAHQELGTALRQLGIGARDLAELARGRAGGPAGEATLALDAELREPIVPAYQIERLPDGGHAVRVTTFLPVTRPSKMRDGSPGPLVTGIEAVMLESRPGEGPTGRAIVSRPTRDLGLTHGEEGRVPFRDSVEGRWRRTEGPNSVQALLDGQAPRASLAKLHAEVASTFRRYIWVRDPRLTDLLASYVLVTYFWDLWNAVPYLHLWGTRESGKSNVATLLTALAFNAEKASSQSQAVLFRSAHANRGLRVLEEAESLSDPKPGTDAEALRLISNDGYKRGAKVYRMEGEGASLQPRGFDVFGPKVFASIDTLEYVLASRCVQVHMVRATLGDLKASGVRDLVQDAAEAERAIAELRDALYVALLTRVEDVAKAGAWLAKWPGLGHLGGRQREMWMPLLAVTFAAQVEDAEELAAERAGPAWADFPQAERHRAGLAVLTEQLGDVGSLINQMVALQRELEAKARQAEAEASLDTSALKILHAILLGGDILPLRTDPWNQRLAGWSTKDLAAMVEQDLIEAGFQTRQGRGLFSPRRLRTLLAKNMILDAAHPPFETMVPSLDGGSKRAKGIWIDLAHLEAALERLGVASDPPAQGAQSLAGVA